MTAYSALARHYDALMRHVDYPRFADALSPFLGHTVLDLGCGTGVLSCLLAEKGFEMIGVDGSADMLTQARAKRGDVLWLCQRMSELDLYGTVQAALCTLDGLNYLTVPGELLETLRRVRLFLEPGSPFIFDVHAPGKLAALDGQSLVTRARDAFCVWEHRWQAPECVYALTLFERSGASWRRFTERHRQREYTQAELFGALREAGFSSARIDEGELGGLGGADSGRLVFIALA